MCMDRWIDGRMDERTNEISFKTDINYNWYRLTGTAYNEYWAPNTLDAAY